MTSQLVILFHRVRHFRLIFAKLKQVNRTTEYLLAGASKLTFENAFERFCNDPHVECAIYDQWSTVMSESYTFCIQLLCDSAIHRKSWSNSWCHQPSSPRESASKNNGAKIDQAPLRSWICQPISQKRGPSFWEFRSAGDFSSLSWNQKNIVINCSSQHCKQQYKPQKVELFPTLRCDISVIYCADRLRYSKKCVKSEGTKSGTTAWHASQYQLQAKDKDIQRHKIHRGSWVTKWVKTQKEMKHPSVHSSLTLALLNDQRCISKSHMETPHLHRHPRQNPPSSSESGSQRYRSLSGTRFVKQQRSTWPKSCKQFEEKYIKALWTSVESLSP